jgi:hypothetical protein
VEAVAVAAAGEAVVTADMEEGAVVIATVTTRITIITTAGPMSTAAATATSTRQPRTDERVAQSLRRPRALAWQALSLNHRQVLVVIVVVKMDRVLGVIALSILYPLI